MSPIVIIGIGALAWILICLFVLALCVAARRGDEILRGTPRPGRTPGWPIR